MAGAQTALLIAAHGERRAGASNESVLRIARAVAAKKIVSAVAVGFIRGEPSIGEALQRLSGPKVIVYPLFVANGYFTRDRLVQLLDETNGKGRSISLLPPLGLDRGLPKLVADHAARVARERGFSPGASTVVLLAHGSRQNPASREATEQMAAEVTKLGMCRAARVAFLEERPFLEEAVRTCPGPVIVVGMFSGEGLHGARDAPCLVARLGRPEVIYSGVIGNAPGVDEAVSSSVARAVAED